MRLSRIKIAGFKSFVDPTDLKLPSQRVGIVGPNGCGKSNTIDAVRWVMGESSAKHLRGESMDDVIFAGSSARQPIGQASVELIFDNSDGSLGGEYAAFSEISIRREVNRDGQSRYLLNNVRCRRRDIRDIFLGTGLGPRSYAIIEQGMISRLIEAKPEDMRVYLEEAAGISKYKERRRETETRIRHTRENLERLDDLREEVDKQLAQLKRQASMAEKYRALNAEADQKRSELLLLRRRELQAERDQQAAEISTQEAELEAAVSELRAAESAIELARAQQAEATETFSSVQANFYRSGSELARLEQTIEHKTETRNQHSQELAEVSQNLDELMTHVQEDQARLEQIAASIENDEPAFNLLKESQILSAEHLVRAERELQEWQQRHETFNRRFSESSQIAQVERSRIEQFERNLAAADTRISRLCDERDTLDLEPLQAAVEDSLAELDTASEAEEQLRESVERTSEHQQQQKEAIAETAARLDTLRGQIQTGMGRLASLEALQQAALEESGQAADEWLKAQQLDQAQRLAQTIHTEPGWEQATELVLGHFLEAVCLDNTAEINLQTLIGQLPDASLTLIESVPENSTGTVAAPVQTLGSQVRGAEALLPWLSRIYLADSPEQALQRRTTLTADESVVTRCGLWLGASWLRVARGENQDSVLLREGEITTLKAHLDTLEEESDVLKARLDTLNEQFDELETRRETQQHAFNDAVRTHSQVQSQLHAEQQRLEQAERRQRTLSDELAEINGLREHDQLQLETATAHRLEAMQLLEALEDEKHQLEDEQRTLQHNLDEARLQRDADRDAGQELAVRVESMRSTRQATEQNLERMQTRIRQLTERQNILQQHVSAEADDTLDALKGELEQALADKLGSEQSLQAAREQLDSVELRLREHEQARQRHDARAQKLRDQVQNQRMRAQEAVVRLKTLDEQLAEQNCDVAEIEAALDPEASIEVWAEALARLERQIQRLGNINMAAIDQLAEQQERKEHLDEQHLDVSEALLTLERAIAKIDRETRARFRETFDQVNTKVQEFFPRLFGGGRGELQMTGDDLLSTGVNINAQPPGKRVSNIQLLSGGEKALTAVALVFAFFELNPSPFCMLDEVDAPLDDANVGRFCTLVREMSERVQFIFITHNKVTMEMADQLMGVTMNEPGVSRLVAVDVHEAVELAGV